MSSDDYIFEQEVVRIARNLWSAPYGGATIEDGQERDGVFLTDEIVHLIECTTSRRKDKAEQDANKLIKLIDQMRSQYPTKAVKGWFITKYEPTADQNKAVQRIGNKSIVAISHEGFKAQLIDVISYLRCRQNHNFGSMQDLNTGSPITKIFDDYIPLDMFSEGDEKSFNIDQVADSLIPGKSFVVLGDYGAGKSTTTRELFINLAKRYEGKETLKFPVHINLREHYGQTDTTEALERHARKIGFSKPDHLVRAWHAGEVVLILDGFDEIAILGWTQQARTLKSIRFRSMELVRGFINNIPDSASILVSGRSYFFDTQKELTNALGIKNRFTILSLSDFTEEQIRLYLDKVKYKGGNIPEWLPSRPLLLGSLASKDLLREAINIDGDLSPAAGWDILLTKISEREAKTEFGIDADTVRVLIERLASNARLTSDGLGSLQQEDLIQVFNEVCGYPPDEKGITLLQRLPGLAPHKQEDGSRGFIDKDLVDAARAGDVIRYMDNPFSFDIKNRMNWQVTLGELGCSLAAIRLLNQADGGKNNHRKASTAAQEAVKTGESHVLAGDIIQVMKDAGFSYEGKSITIKNTTFVDMNFGDTDVNFSGIDFQDCLFQRFGLSIDANPNLLPKFIECYFGVFEGRLSRSDLPETSFDASCIIDSFGDSADTISASLNNQSLPLGVRVLLTVLKKVYLQAGGGRKESTLFRGLHPQARSLINPVLALLKSENILINSTSRRESIWLPIRGQAARVHRILIAPTESQDPLVKKAADIE